MTLTAWDIYWVTRLDEISIVLTMVCIACCFALLWVSFMMIPPIGGSEAALVKRVGRVALLVLVITAMCNSFIPNAKQAAAMIVLPAIVNSDAVQQLPGELTILAREWLHELRPTQVSKKDSK